MLVLSLAAHAVTVEVPLRVTFTEYTDVGQNPTVVDDVLSATARVSNADTGTEFLTSGELLLREKTGAGAGEMSFVDDPSGSTRTWSLYLLDAAGQPLGNDPEIVVVAVGNDGSGTIAARVNADIVVRTVRMKKRGVSRVGNTDDGTHQVRVEVQGGGIRAAYVGIQELSADGAALSVHADLDAMTAEVYASFQAFALDAIVPLDSWSATLAGTLAVEGMSVAGTTVEGGSPIGYDLAFGAAVCPEGSRAICVTLPSASYIGEPLTARTKGQALRANKVALRPDDEVFDSYDAAMDLVLEGDARGIEVLAVLTPKGDAPKPEDAEWLLLSPDDLTVEASTTMQGLFPDSPDEETILTAGIQPLGEGGVPLRSWLECTLTPTATSATAGSTELRWVGECVRDEEGLALVRAFQMTMDASGAASIGVELLGAEWQDATALAFDIDGERLKLSSAEGPASVASVAFTFGWSFAEDIDGDAFALDVAMWGPPGAVEFTVERAGWFTWTPEDGSEARFTYQVSDQSRGQNAVVEKSLGGMLAGMGRAGASR